MNKNLEWFLRRNFGLEGEYLSEECKRAYAIKNPEERNAAIEAILEEKGPEGLYSREAWASWERALAMVDDLVEMGIIDEDNSDSPAWIIRHGFCDNA